MARMRLKEDSKTKKDKEKQEKTRKTKIEKKRGMYMRLVDHGSIEGRLEASHMISENLQAEVDVMT